MFLASLCPSSGEQRPSYCIWRVVLVLLGVVGSGCGALRCRMWALWTETFIVLASCNTTPHNRYQPHPAEPEHTKCSNRAFALLKMGIMMPETCWDRSTRSSALVLASYNAAPHNRYQPHPAEPERHTKCSNRAFALLKMGIMMPETCWDRSTSARILQRSAPQPLPTTPSRTRTTHQMQ